MSNLWSCVLLLADLHGNYALMSWYTLLPIFQFSCNVNFSGVYPSTVHCAQKKTRKKTKHNIAVVCFPHGQLPVLL